MEYIIAQFRIRTEGRHDNLVECGVRGFAPFAVEPSDCKADMILRPDEGLSLDEFTDLRELHRFGFEEDLADCCLYAHSDGYLFTMEKGSELHIYAKANGSEVVRTNYDSFERIDASLLRFGLWISFGLCTAHLGAIAIHSSVIVKDGGAVLCLGESGTGKSTHTRLWRENIEGAKLLNDDSPIIRIVDGVATAFGSPWSGKTPCYRNLHYPIKGFLRLSQAPHNRIKRLSVLNAIGALLPSCPPAFAYDEQLQDAVCETLSQMIGSVGVYHLECLPDAAAAQLSHDTILGR